MEHSGSPINSQNTIAWAVRVVGMKGVGVCHLQRARPDQHARHLPVDVGCPTPEAAGTLTKGVGDTRDRVCQSRPVESPECGSAKGASASTTL